MIRAIVAVVVTVLILHVSPGWAQEPTPPDYQAWEQVASQTQELIGNEDVPVTELNDIRARIVEWRSRFESAQDINADEIATVQQQIEALGPAPAEGETEPEDIAARRDQLQRQLSELQAPRVAAVEAFSRADSLVRRIDQAVTARQVSELTRLSPSPVLPANWLLAASETSRLLSGIWENTGQRIAERATWPELRPRLP